MTTGAAFKCFLNPCWPLAASRTRFCFREELAVEGAVNMLTLCLNRDAGELQNVVRPRQVAAGQRHAEKRPVNGRVRQQIFASGTRVCSRGHLSCRLSTGRAHTSCTPRYMSTHGKLPPFFEQYMPALVLSLLYAIDSSATVLKAGPLPPGSSQEAFNPTAIRP